MSASAFWMATWCTIGLLHHSPLEPGQKKEPPSAGYRAASESPVKVWGGYLPGHRESSGVKACKDGRGSRGGGLRASLPRGLWGGGRCRRGRPLDLDGRPLYREGAGAISAGLSQ